MDFSYSEEQQMLQQSVSKFISQDYDWDSRQAIAKSATGFSAEHWQLFAELGWLTIPFKEDDGGFGGSAVDLIVTMQEFGKGLLVEPFLANTILAGTVISEAGSSEQKATLLAPLMEGSLQLAFAYAEPQSRYELSNVQCSAVINGDEMVLNGHKSVVLNGAAAEKILVSVRTSGESCDREGISLIWVDASTPGVRRECYASVDGQRAADIWFDNVALPASNLLGNVGEAIDVIEMTVDKAALAVCAEAVGAMEMSLIENRRIQQNSQAIQGDAFNLSGTTTSHGEYVYRACSGQIYFAHGSDGDGQPKWTMHLKRCRPLKAALARRRDWWAKSRFKFTGALVSPTSLMSDIILSALPRFNFRLVAPITIPPALPPANVK